MKPDAHFEMLATWSTKPAGAERDVADISIRLGNHVLTRIADAEKHTTRDYFRASATGVGLWFADNWWRLRWETIADPRFPSVDWRLRHELNSAAGGTLWPPIMIYSVGDRIVFAPSIGNRPIAGPQQYLDAPISTIGAPEYEIETDRFLETVVQECAGSVDAKALATIVGQIRTERSNAELAGWRRLEACLGYDPDQAPEEVVEALVDLEEIVGEEGVEEAALARPGSEAATTLHLAIEASRESALTVSFELASKIEKSPDLPPFASPWQFAEQAAAQLRSIIGVPHGPLKKDDFASIFHARWIDLKNATATARKLPYGARLAEKGDDERLAIQTVKAHDRRFELARLFGDAVWSSNSDFGVTSRSRTDRQKFQRAFAQSLLVPFADIRQEIDLNAPQPEQIEFAARHYHVHETVVRNLLVYKGVLPFDNLEERLEAV